MKISIKECLWCIEIATCFLRGKVTDGAKKFIFMPSCDHHVVMRPYSKINLEDGEKEILIQEVLES